MGDPPIGRWHVAAAHRLDLNFRFRGKVLDFITGGLNQVALALSFGLNWRSAQL